MDSGVRKMFQRLDEDNRINEAQMREETAKEVLEFADEEQIRRAIMTVTGWESRQELEQKYPDKYSLINDGIMNEMWSPQRIAKYIIRN